MNDGKYAPPPSYPSGMHTIGQTSVTHNFKFPMVVEYKPTSYPTSNVNTIQHSMLVQHVSTLIDVNQRKLMFIVARVYNT